MNRSLCLSQWPKSDTIQQFYFKYFNLSKYSHPQSPACSAMLLALEPQVFFIVKNMERCFRVSETKWGIPLYMLYQEVQMDWTFATRTWPVHKYLTRFFTGFSTSQIVQDISYQQYLEQKSVGSLGRKCRPLLQDTKFMAYEIITKKWSMFFTPCVETIIAEL